jgi:hypothetical protein
MTAMRADVPKHPEEVFDAHGRPSESEGKRVFDELWSELSAQRTKVCTQVFGILCKEVTTRERKRLRDKIPSGSRTEAAQDYAALTEHLSKLGRQAVHDITPTVGQEAFWIKSIASWKKQYRFPEENHATQLERER